MMQSFPLRWLRVSLLAIAGFAAASSASAAAVPPDPLQPLVAPLPAALRKADGVYALFEARGVAEAFGRDEEFSRIIEKIPAAGLPPLNEYFVRLEQANAQLKRLDRAAAARTIAPLGPLTVARFIGLFGAGADGDFTTVFPPEKAIDFTRDYPGKDDLQARWRTLQLPPGDLLFNPGRYVYPAEKGIVYFTAGFTLAVKGRVLFRLGASDQAALFIDGREVFRYSDKHYYAAGQFALALELPAGAHSLLIKQVIADANARLSLSATAADGRPIVFANEVPAAPAPAAGFKAAELLPPPPAGSRPAQYARGLWLWRTQAFRLTEHPELAALKAGAREARTDTARLIQAWAQPEPQHEREALRGCLAEFPASPVCLLRLARLEATRDRPGDALALLEKLPADWRLTPEARVIELAIRGNTPLGAGAADQLAALAAERADRFNLWPAAAELYRAAGREREGLQCLEKALAQAPGQAGLRREIVERRLALGAGEESLTLLTDITDADPLEVGLREDLAGLYLKLDDPEKALRYNDEQLAVSPRDPEGLKLRADALIRLGRDAEGNDALRAAIAARPQDEDLRRYLAFREKGDTGFETPYRVNPRDYLAAAVADHGQGAEIMLQQTVVQVSPSGLASRYKQLIVRIVDETGVKGWEHYGVGFDATTTAFTWLAAQRLRPGDSEAAASLGEGQRGAYTPSDGEDNMYVRQRVGYARFPDLRPGDLVNLELREDPVAASNDYGDYFGDLVILGGGEPIRALRYALLTPKGKTIYHEVNGAADSLIVRELPADPAHGAPERTERRWEFTGLEPRANEPAAPAAIELYPYLHLSTFRDWDALGRWYAGFIRDRFTLDPAQRQEFLDGLDGATGDQALVAVHRRTTHRVHYIGIEFGVHGYQPFSAAESYRRGFGDCKDKATLFCTLAETVGEPAEIVLTRTRDIGNLSTKLASLSLFNHAIAYLPRSKTFVDGTADYVGLGELPVDDQGADVLLVGRDGTSVRRTIPETAASDNLDDQRFIISFPDAAKGDTDRVNIAAKLFTRGAGAPGLRARYAKTDSRDERLERGMAETFSSFKLTRSEYSDVTDYERPVTLGFEGEARKLLRRDGRTLWLAPRLGGDRWQPLFAPLAKRTLPLVLRYRSSRRLEFRYELPAGAKVITLPPGAARETPFGSWKVQWRQESGAVIASSETVFTARRVSPQDYPAYRAFLSTLDDALDASAEIEVAK